MGTFEQLPTDHLSTFSRAQAVRSGYSPHEIAAAVRMGRLVRVRRGAYAAATERTSDPEHLHLLRAHDVRAKLGDGVVLSHQSAILIHRLPVWGASLDTVHVTRVDDRRTRNRAGVESHRVAVCDGEVTRVGSLDVTTVVRSLVDPARSSGFEAAVWSMDAALRRGVVSREGLERSAAGAAGRPGAGDARRAVAFADGGSESVDESRLRVATHELGLPPPVLQHLFRDEDGRPVGRVDFWWPNVNVIGEFDGLVKYRGTMGNPVEVLIAEKRREDALRALTGAPVVRVTWRELDDRRRLERTLRRAVAG